MQREMELHRIVCINGELYIYDRNNYCSKGSGTFLVDNHLPNIVILLFRDPHLLKCSLHAKKKQEQREIKAEVLKHTHTKSFTILHKTFDAATMDIILAGSLSKLLTSDARMDPPIHELNLLSTVLEFCTILTRILCIKKDPHSHKVTYNRVQYTLIHYILAPPTHTHTHCLT